jgi:hypothetical protein
VSLELICHCSHLSPDRNSRLEAYEAMKSAGQIKAKKTYSKPVLKTYGDIGVLTATVFNSFSAHSDGGTGGMNKTH